uniref:Uncharacterized protein n=1 Tax=Anguilla anguilla TaxID=7936 RepID=A0A0E9P8Q4_ANGAN
MPMQLLNSPNSLHTALGHFAFVNT